MVPGPGQSNELSMLSSDHGSIWQAVKDTLLWPCAYTYVGMYIHTYLPVH